MNLFHSEAQLFLEQPVAWAAQGGSGQSIPAIITGQHDDQIVCNAERCLPQCLIALDHLITLCFMTHKFGKFSGRISRLWPYTENTITKLLTQAKLMPSPFSRRININPTSLHGRKPQRNNPWLGTVR